MIAFRAQEVGAANFAAHSGSGGRGRAKERRSAFDGWTSRFAACRRKDGGLTGGGRLGGPVRTKKKKNCLEIIVKNIKCVSHFLGL